MTRNRFIRKWLSNKADYNQENMDSMSNDLDKVIDFHRNTCSVDEFITTIEENQKNSNTDITINAKPIITYKENERRR